MGGYRVISSDSHVAEPPDLWTNRIDPKFRDRAPHVIHSEEDGYDWWVCDDKRIIHAGVGAQAGRRFEAPESLQEADVFENVRPGGYIPEEQVKDMDIDGVDVNIIYPTSTLGMYSVLDGELISSIFRTYNDWIAEFCRPFPNRLKSIALLNLDNVPEGVRELERCAKMGAAGAVISVYPPEDRSYHLAEYDPLWAAAQDLEIPLSLHIGTIRPSRGQDFAALLSLQDRPTIISNVDHWVRMSLGDMIFSGVFERFPKLRVGSVEHEVSWAPHFLERIDYAYTQRARKQSWHRFNEDMLPTDYFHRNVFISFQEDGLGIKQRDIIGVDNLLWGSDYPHTETTFPRSREILEDILVDCTEEEKAKIAGGNAARIYRLN